MNFWLPYPFFRYLLFLVPGIILGLKVETGLLYPLIFTAGSIILFVIIRIAGSNYRHTNAVRFSIGLTIAIFLLNLGICITFLTIEKNHPHHIYNQKKVLAYTARIVSEEGETERYYKTIVEVRTILNDTGYIPAKGKVLLYITKTELKQYPKRNSLILIKGSPFLIPPPSNPGTFDYREFLSTKKIYHQHFAHPENLSFWGEYSTRNIFGISYELRNYLTKLIKEKFEHQENLAVANAMLLGDKRYLPTELRNSYATAGAMHVLAVSGLHVGIILLCINFFLSWIPDKFLIAKVFKTFAVIGLLWIYALITGLSPSVLRSATMFTFLQFGITFFRSSNMLNNIAISAFILLIINPLYILDTGFQLSYSAVIAIVTLHPTLYNLFTSRFWLINKSWEIISVSLAAQTGTFIPCLFYFNQFPVYFLLTNLLITLPVLVLVFLGFTIMILSLIFNLPDIFFEVLEGVTACLNYLIQLVEAIPGSLIKHIYLSAPECLTAGAALIFFLFFLHTRKFTHYAAAACFFIITLTIKLSTNYFYNNKKGIIVWRTPGYHSIALLNGQNSMVITNNPDVNSVKYLADSYLRRYGLNYTLYTTEEALTLGKIALETKENTCYLSWLNNIYIISSSHQTNVSYQQQTPNNIHPQIIYVGKENAYNNKNFYNTSSKGAYIKYLN